MSRDRAPGGARPLAAVLALVTAALVTVLTGAAPAQAAGYRYWSFWQADGTTWTYATEGPATARPADGAVHGFRFAVSADSSDASQPRPAPDFDAVCGSTPAEDGKKRVALVIDSGTATDAAGGESPPDVRAVCAKVAGSATTAEALAQVAKPLRYDGNALLCAISGYPAQGCGEQVSDTSKKSEQAEETAPSAKAVESDAQDDGGPSLGTVAGLAVFLVLGAATFWQIRRRRP
ncbi:SCO2322 family protein [Streptomyces sp. NPDC048057]|uniref:SCO2322 family protein n=1 Tax=Streptomyces sp. NPDC048057 TaxID=3155628 RepID=UPI0033F32373